MINHSLIQSDPKRALPGPVGVHQGIRLTEAQHEFAVILGKLLAKLWNQETEKHVLDSPAILGGGTKQTLEEF